MSHITTTLFLLGTMALTAHAASDPSIVNLSNNLGNVAGQIANLQLGESLSIGHLKMSFRDQANHHSTVTDFYIVRTGGHEYTLVWSERGETMNFNLANARDVFFLENETKIIFTDAVSGQLYILSCVQQLQTRYPNALKAMENVLQTVNNDETPVSLSDVSRLITRIYGRNSTTKTTPKTQPMPTLAKEIKGKLESKTFGDKQAMVKAYMLKVKGYCDTHRVKKSKTTITREDQKKCLLAQHAGAKCGICGKAYNCRPTTY